MRRAATLLTCLLILSTAAFAEDRQKIGLVLGGGGAKGAAHIGVLQVLDELRVPVDCVAGASMGALVGATFASGRTGDEIETLIREIDWRETVGGVGLRRDTPIENKVSGLDAGQGFELGLTTTGPTAPGGLIPSQRIESVIRSLIGGARDATSFDELPLPFRAIATDLIKAETVIMDSGDLAVAMRASMAAPGAFSPVVVGEQVLADGGLTNNVPIDVARDLCADVVIASWNEVPPYTPDDLSDALTLIDRSVNVMIIARELEQIRTLTSADVGIPVQTGDIGAADFLRADDAIELGRQSALAQADALKRYALPEAEYLAWRQTLTERPGSQPIQLASVDVVGENRVSEAFVRKHLVHTNQGKAVTRREIAEDVQRIFALGDFERVDYVLSGAADNPTLEFRLQEKSWGPDFLRLDFGLASTGDDDLRALVRADHTRTWVNGRGGRWENALQLGQRSLASTRFYQPLDVHQDVFVEFGAGYANSLEDIYDGRDRIARYDFDEWSAQLTLGANFGTRAQLRASLTSGTTSADIDTGLPQLSELSSTSYTSLGMQAIYDTRDDVRLPTQGTYTNIVYRKTDSDWGGDLDFETIDGVITRAFDWNGDSFSLILGGGERLSGALPLTRQFQLGGIRTFPGLRPGELRGERYWYSGASYARRLANIAPLFGQSLYGGLRLTAGDMQNQLDGVDEGTYYGITGSLLGRTPVGAFLLSLSWLDNDQVSLQFSLGRPLDEGSLLDGID